jgi:hypothetical protein
MTANEPPDRGTEAFWHDYLTRGASMERRQEPTEVVSLHVGRLAE